MAKVCAIAGSMLVGGHALRSELTDEDMLSTSNHCADFQSTLTYAPCSVLVNDPTGMTPASLLTSVCNDPRAPSDVITKLRKSKCIKCDKEELAEYCKDQVEPCSKDKIGEENEEMVCKSSLFGISGKGRKITETGFGEYLANAKIGCTLMSVATYCADYPFAACDVGGNKDHVCNIVQQKSAEDAVADVGGRWAMKCSKAEVRELCGKQSCADFTEDEWENFCEEKRNHGVSHADAVAFMADDAMTCSIEEVKTMCKTTCKMDAAQENAVCFGYSSKGRPAREYKFKGVGGCDSNQVKAHCADKDWPACDTIDAESKQIIQERACPQRTAELADMIGGVHGVKCSEEDLDDLCNR